jgi:hypothetical protein
VERRASELPVGETMALYITRCFTNITTKQVINSTMTQGSVATPGAVTGFSGVSAIVGIMAALSATITSAATEALVFCRISGGIQGGEQDICIGALTGGFTTPGNVAFFNFTNLPLPPIPLAAAGTSGAGTITLTVDTDTGGTIVNKLDVGITLVLA